MLRIKKVVKRPRKKSLLPIADGARAFWVHQGPVLRSLRDLAKFLEIITVEQFAYHTERGRNDFARWMEEVLQDKVCARALARAKTRARALLACRRALLRYNV